MRTSLFTFNRLYEERITEDFGEGLIIDVVTSLLKKCLETTSGKKNQMFLSIGIDARIDTPAQLSSDDFILAYIRQCSSGSMEVCLQRGPRFPYIYFKDGNEKNKHVNNISV